ncbi:hypothetical protein FQN57_005025 [Myotisia sp. PD_48]|nr:hypothetical protein FQN57_005025 [Myotisia sp. PD_48]
MGSPNIQTRKAIIIQGPGDAQLVERRLPPIPDRFMLVKPVAVALNPTDWKHIDLGVVGSVVGCDYAGIVEAVGKGIRKKFKKGDKVYGPAHGCSRREPEYGAFANYIFVKGDIQSLIPNNLSFEEASTLGVGLITVCQGLYLGLGLDPPNAPALRKTPILIYGGSTATGSLGIQFAKLSGYDPITVCSTRHFDFVKKLGAVAAFDYHDFDCGPKIREYTNNKLKLAWDTISLPGSARICSHALSSNSGGKYWALLPEPSPRDDVESKYTLAYYMFGEKVQLSENGPISPPDHTSFRYAKDFLTIANKLMGEGKIKVHPQHVGPRGLIGVLEGLDKMRQGKVSGVKLVYRVAETPGLEELE